MTWIRSAERFIALVILVTAAACGDDDAAGGVDAGNDATVGSEGPPGQANAFVHRVGDVARGRTVFRMETFGNEGFWTDAARLPQGVVAKNFTPLDALKAGYNVNVEALDQPTKDAIAAELLTDLSPTNAPKLNSLATTIALVNANAVIGVVAKDSNNDGKIDVSTGDKVGVSCAFCHAITDGSVYSMPRGGSIGIEIDGPTPHFLNVGATFAIADNTRAFYPMAQLALTANGGKTIGRAPTGLTETSSEADFDAYFGNPAFYPVGMFDDADDGNGAPMHITPLFRTDLAAPWGSEGTITKLDNFGNLVYTSLLDPTNITTAGGRKFLNRVGGAAGDEIVDDYVKVLAATGVTTYPFVTVATTTAGTGPGLPIDETGPLGVRVDDQKLIDMNAYLNGQPAPAGQAGDVAAIARGRQLFRTTCTGCHNVDQSRFVPQMLLPMKTIFPGDAPMVLAMRDAPLNAVQDTAGSFFDDKMVVVNASFRGEARGIVMPLLLDLARKPSFLHDDSVPNLNTLLDPSRGSTAPHPVYLDAASDRSDMIAFLVSLATM